jgi:hypothetical protein
MAIESLILDPSDMTMLPIFENFLDRPRRLKYDEYNGKLYQIIWTPEAEKMRKARQLELRRQKYRSTHPEKPKQELSLYLRKKQKRIEAEIALRNSVDLDIAGNCVKLNTDALDSALLMMSSQTVSSV